MAYSGMGPYMPYKKGKDIHWRLMGHHMFEMVEPMEFYRDIFPDGELDTFGAMTKGKYNGIAIELTKDTQKDGGRIRRHSFFNDLDKIDELTYSTDFCFTSPISYAGKRRISENARFMYALCIEIDSLRQEKDNKFAGLDDLVHQCKSGFLPKPTYIVASGNGIHLYYVFQKPIPLFKDVAKSIARYKRVMTKRMWNKYVTTLYHDGEIQYESIFQAFRMPGTLTKAGLAAYEKTGQRSWEDVTIAFRFGDGERVSIEYMNSFIKDESKHMTVIYKRTGLSLEEAKEAYPEWYEKKIVQGIKENDQWYCNRGLYDWWKDRILSEGQVGHRYHCLMMLCIYAIKCGEDNVSYEELEKDCFEIMEYFDTLTIDEKNRFTERDVLAALQAYEDKGYATYPINSISHRSGIEIKKNKRNGRKLKEHLQAEVWINDKGRPTTNICKRNRELALGYMREQGQIMGRPTKHRQIQEWRFMNPDGKKADCIRELNIDKKTVYKWWDVPHEEVENEVAALQNIIQELEPDWSELLKELNEE